MRSWGGNDRRGDTQFRGLRRRCDDIRHHAALVARRRLERRALKFMILPMVALSLAHIASIARITRGSMIEVLHSNFIRTARAKGLPPMRRHYFASCAETCSAAGSFLYMGPAFVGSPAQWSSKRSTVFRVLVSNKLLNGA